MTDTTTEACYAPSGDGGWVTAAAREDAARATYRQRLAAGEKLTGAQLGALFDRSGRWGRYRIAEVVRGRPPDGEPGREPGNGQVAAGSNGHGPNPASDAAGGHRDGHGGLSSAGGSRCSSDGSRNGRHAAANGQDTASKVARLPVGTNGNGTPATVHDERLDTATRRVDATTRRPWSALLPMTAASAAAVPADRAEPAEQAPAWVGRLTVASVVLVAIAAAVASVDHLAEVARLAGTAGWKAWLLPAAVDGLASAAALALYRAHKLDEPAGGVASLALIVGVGASVAGNVIAVHPELLDTDTLKVAVGATPPLSLALAVHLALGNVRGPRWRQNHSTA